MARFSQRKIKGIFGVRIGEVLIDFGTRMAIVHGYRDL
jgi:hypothetical protein